MLKEKFWEILIGDDGEATVTIRPPLPFSAEDAALVRTKGTVSLELSAPGAKISFSLDDDLAVDMQEVMQVRVMEFGLDSEKCLRDILIYMS